MEDQIVVAEKAMKLKSQDIGRNSKWTLNSPRAVVESHCESGAAYLRDEEN